MVDGTLLFDTGVDKSGFERGISTLQVAAGTALGNIASAITGRISNIAAEIPAQIITIGSGFEASMSQVAATMGITSAAAEFEVLSDAAKEMGETTKFSASQAGEALNYLALAGYDAEKAVSALPTVLNVAAAGGMELAEASDMITDAMSALGLETSQMADFADKLAVTSQKSNTSVAQLGSAILTVGGTAKQLAGGVVEMNTALGLLADNGIKGAEGGTALRNIILSLTAPTNTAAEAIDALGLQVYDAEGKMRSLQDIMFDLNDILNSMSTDAERNQALNDVFNKVDLKSVNALLGTSAERWNELSGYIDNCTGAAEQMATTMDDNLKGDLTIMNSALEGLGIAAYEKFQVPLREAVQSVTADLGTLTASLTEGGLSQSFDKVSESLSKVLSEMSEVLANDILPAVITGLEKIIDHSNEIIALIAGIGVAVAAFKISTVIMGAVAAIQTANVQLSLLSLQSGAAAVSQAALAGSLSATEVAVGVFTGKITLATAAQSAFNAVVATGTLTILASTAALTALAAVTIGAALAFAKYVSEMETAAAVDPWYEQAQKNVEAIREERDAYQELLDTQNENIAADNAKASNIERLWGELQKYVDANGNVISSHERAAEIIGTLNSAYGLNIEYIDGQIQSYDKLAGSMDDYIEKLRLEAKIRNMQPAYDEAIAKQEEYNNKRLELEKKLQLKIAAFQAADNNDVKGVFAVQIGGIREELQLLDETTAMYQQTISDFEGLFAENSNTSPWSDYFQKQSEWLVEAQQDASEATKLSQEEAEKKLKEGWQQAEHNYAIGLIASDEELIAEKQRIWNEYGDESCTDHWKYYENLIGLQNDYADDIKKANEKLVDEQKASVKAEWDTIEHQNKIGLLSDEDTYKAKLAFIQKYCPEYSDEWYDYYKDIYDYQKSVGDEQLETLKGSMQEQVDVVSESLKDIVSEYKEAYKKIQDNIDSYKKKLLSVGDALSVIKNKDGSKTLKVNDLREQLAAMREYHKYMTELKNAGASAGLLSELNSMDFADSSAFAKNLAGLSSSDFAQINDYYKEKEQLAQELANELYQPDIDKINTDLVANIKSTLGTELPEVMRTAGMAALDEFIAGLTGNNLAEQVEDFGTKFTKDLSESIKNGINNDDFAIDFDNLFTQDPYTAGQNFGSDFADGFNAALEEMTVAVQAEQAQVSAEYTMKNTSAAAENADAAGTKSKTSSASECIVIENHVHAQLDVDGRKMAETTIEYEDIINREKGK